MLGLGSLDLIEVLRVRRAGQRRWGREQELGAIVERERCDAEKLGLEHRSEGWRCRLPDAWTRCRVEGVGGGESVVGPCRKMQASELASWASNDAWLSGNNDDEDRVRSGNRRIGVHSRIRAPSCTVRSILERTRLATAHLRGPNRVNGPGVAREIIGLVIWASQQ